MAATVTDAALDLLIRWILGIATPEPLAVMLFSDPPDPNQLSVFADFTQTPLPGGGAVGLVAGSWSDESTSGRGDYVYPVIPYTFTTTVSGGTIWGYLVYSVVSSTVLWFELFPDPWIIPPTGGVGYLNLEVADLNFPPP